MTSEGSTLEDELHLHDSSAIDSFDSPWSDLPQSDRRRSPVDETSSTTFRHRRGFVPAPVGPASCEPPGNFGPIRSSTPIMPSTILEAQYASHLAVRLAKI